MLKRPLIHTVSRIRSIRTVFLPSTKFGSRSDDTLIQSTLKPQTTNELYEWNKSKPIESINELFILHDGPPYANGHLHIGHALNKILKDIIVRFQLLSGKKIHYVPGWDCHGLPIELKTLEKLNKEKKDLEKSLKKEFKKTGDQSVLKRLEDLKKSKLSSSEIIKLATDHALNAQSIQSEEFQQMAILGDFAHPYLTLQNSYIANQLRVFKKFFDLGLVHRQEKPVYWGCENSTALAEGELEYNNNHVSKAAYVKFPILGSLHGFDDVHALIWTSTPWTLASNLAISFNKDLKYTIIKCEYGNLVVSVDLLDNLSKLFNFEKTGVEFSGSELLKHKYRSPILNNDKTFPFLHGDHVTNITGTGLVHTAAGHGHDDYLVCLKNGIKPYSPVDQYGKYTKDLPSNLKDFVGLKVLGDGNNKMIELLKDLDILVNLNENYVHSYPYDWRSKKPIIIRSTPQWFIDVSKIKDITIEKLTSDVKFHPERGINRLSSFIRNRNEWCISRQRSWGVPIPVLYHKETGEAIMNDDIIEHIIKVINVENINNWFENDISKWLPEEYKHLASDYVLGVDTMDVWFDSGSSWKTIESYLHQENLLDQAIERGYLSDVYLEGSDQHRGWFQSSVLTKVGTSDNEVITMPYKTIVTHGFTLDERGEKMSKSIGNTISPVDILNGNKSNNIPKIGIDGLRLWVAQSDYTNDINVGSTILKHVGDNLKKIRFTFKFLLGNLNEFNGDVKYDDLNKIDKYVLSKLWKLNDACLNDYREYNYFKIIKNLNHFINVDLSSIYFDIRKDSLYTDDLLSSKRISTLYTFQIILKSLVSILAPILPIITQEVWNNMSKNLTKELSTPFHSGWFNSSYIRQDLAIEEEFGAIFKFKDSINLLVNKLKNEKVINTPLEAVVTIPKDDVLDKYSDDELMDIFVVSGIKRGDNLEVVKSDDFKCPRCWKHNSKKEDQLCQRCDDVVNK